MSADGKRLVYSGDTGYDEAFATWAKGCDVLVLECSLPDSMAIPEHLTPEQCGELAHLAEPRTLVLTHLYPPVEDEDILVAAGDVIFVQRAPVFYVYGEVQSPGSYRIERDMTVRQALAQGGGLTTRGSERRLQLHRRDESGKLTVIQPRLDDPIRPDDVLQVREAWF